MTPEYASPEQVRGETMTTASDIYSLGVVLYELLTGSKPHGVATRRVDEIARAITTEIPLRPSHAITARATQLPAPRAPADVDRARQLRGDLDNIVMMALRKEPERRYASVALLSEDIRRHLAGRPVIARKDTAGYRASKFIARNKAAVAAAALVLLALVGGIITTSWQARVARVERAKAERRFNDVRKLANSYLFEFHDAIESLPGSTPARALLVKRALEYLDSLAREASGDPSLQREVAMAYLKVGNVQGNPTNPNLGDTAGALESYQKALASAQASAATAPGRPLALIHEKMADVLAATDRVAEGVQSARTSLAIFNQLAQANPDPAAQLSAAISRLKLGDILGNPNFVNAGDQQGAMENYRSSAAMLNSLHAADPQNPKIRRFVGIIHERIGAMLESQNDAPGAVAEYQKSAEIRVPFAAEFPNDTALLRDAAIAYEKLGHAMTAIGNLAAALENRRKSIEMLRYLLQADPTNTSAQHSLAVSYIHLGDVLGGPELPNVGRAAEAIECYRKALQLFEKANSADAANVRTRRDLAEVQAKLAKLTAQPPP